MVARAAVRAKNPIRRDPEPRPLQGFDPTAITISGKDPERDYILAYDVEVPGSGTGWYEAIGYETEVKREGGPNIVGCKAKTGDVIKYMGHVLMSCTAEHRRLIDEYGLGGNSGQKRADQIERHMIDNTKDNDSMRGGDRRYGRNTGHGIPTSSFMEVAEGTEPPLYPEDPDGLPE